MKRKKDFFMLNLLGIFFISLSITAIAISIYNKNPTQVLYMCYLGLFLIGLGILMKRSVIILSQVYILTIPLFVWTLDFLHWIFLGRPLFGITDYFFVGYHPLISKIISLQHLYTIPLSVYVVRKIGTQKKDLSAWKWSFIQIIGVYAFVSLFSPPSLNINCVFNSCIEINFGLPYRLTWFIIIFSMTFLSSLIINLWIYLKHNNK